MANIFNIINFGGHHEGSEESRKDDAAPLESLSLLHPAPVQSLQGPRCHRTPTAPLPPQSLHSS